MKRYEETINDVFRRIGAYREQQKKRRNLLKKTAASLCCVCLLAFIGLGIYHSALTPAGEEPAASAVAGVSSSNNSNKEGQSPGVGNIAHLPNGAEPPVSYRRIIRSYSYIGNEPCALPQNGEIMMTAPLRKALEEYGGDVVYYIEIVPVKNASATETGKAGLMREFERLSGKATADGSAVSFETYAGQDGEHYILSGIVTKYFMESFPASEQYGYILSLYDERALGASEAPSAGIYNRVVNP